MFPIYQILFYVFAIILVVSAVMVITVRQPVLAVLYLVLCFVASSVLWIMLQAEFLGLVLIFVYVGAVMTLFLFVVMMLNLDLAELRGRFIHFLPIGFLATALMIFIVIYAIEPKHSALFVGQLTPLSAEYSNTAEIGSILYTTYVLPFEIAGLLLLVAIIASITLAFYGKKAGTKTQILSVQHKANKKERLRVIDMKVK